MNETIRYRLGWRQSPWYLLPFPVANLVLAGDDLPVALVYAMSVAFVAIFAAAFAWQRTFGVELRPDALVMYGLTTRVVPWHDVSWIGPSPTLGTKAVGVEFGHRRWRLRAPVHTPFLAPDRDFLEKARTIYTYWERATSTGSAP